MTWIILETYYKHAEYDLIIKYSDESLRKYLIEQLINYDEDEHDLETKELTELIELAVELGNKIVKNECGWGIREIQKV